MPLNVSENSEPLQTFRSNTFDGSDKKGRFFGTEFHGLFADFFHFSYLGLVCRCSCLFCSSEEEVNGLWLSDVNIGNRHCLFVVFSVFCVYLFVHLPDVNLRRGHHCQFLRPLCQGRFCQCHWMACRPPQPQNGCKTIPRGNERNEVIPRTLKGMFPFEEPLESLWPQYKTALSFVGTRPLQISFRGAKCPEGNSAPGQNCPFSIALILPLILDW